MELTPSTIYRLLLNHFGIQNWWPVDYDYHKIKSSDPRFEIIVGAILTQNTAWLNVEKALKNLKEKNSLQLSKIVDTDLKNLKTMIQPSGFFNQKAQRLKSLATHIYDNYCDDLDKFFNREIKEIRIELLSLNGIGPETADSILLYAGNHPIFVVDAYTKRICKRVPVKVGKESYDDIQRYFEDDIKKNLPIKDAVQLYKELHALIVEWAKKYCRINPTCYKCPLKKYCKFKLKMGNKDTK